MQAPSRMRKRLAVALRPYFPRAPRPRGCRFRCRRRWCARASGRRARAGSGVGGEDVRGWPRGSAPAPRCRSWRGPWSGAARAASAHVLTCSGSTGCERQFPAGRVLNRLAIKRRVVDRFHASCVCDRDRSIPARSAPQCLAPAVQNPCVSSTTAAVPRSVLGEWRHLVAGSRVGWSLGGAVFCALHRGGGANAARST